MPDKELYRARVLPASLIKFTVMLHIPGTSLVEHLEENVAATGLELSGEEVATFSG